MRLMPATFVRLLREEHGSDLIEYALLAATVGVGAAAGLSLFPGAMNAVYTAWDADTQDLWEPLDPQ